MLHAQDLEVWELAKEKSLCIVSKDRDFAALAGLHIPPPKVIWLRVGNCATVEVRQLILKHAEILREFLDSDEANIIVLPPGLMS